jgi:hypothetical protein
LNIGLAILAFLIRGFFSPSMTAFLMTLGNLPNDAPQRRLRRRHWRRACGLVLSSACLYRKGQ